MKQRGQDDSNYDSMSVVSVITGGRPLKNMLGDKTPNPNKKIKKIKSRLSKFDDSITRQKESVKSNTRKLSIQPKDTNVTEVVIA